jgi:hypothetical protein
MDCFRRCSLCTVRYDLLGLAHEYRLFSAPASLLSSSSTSTVKRKKFGKSKGKSIDASASFNSWKEEYKDDLETIPITRKGATVVFVFCNNCSLICACFSPTSTFVKRYTAGSTSRRQSGIEATSFHGKSETTRQTTMTGQSCPSIRRKSDRTNKKGKTKHTPETITIDDDSESEVEQVRLCIALCVYVSMACCAYAID